MALMKTLSFLSTVAISSGHYGASAFITTPMESKKVVGQSLAMNVKKSDDQEDVASAGLSRRDLLSSLTIIPIIASDVLLPGREAAVAAEFTPGGTLVDRDVGITVGNSEASLSRKFDNANVLFYQDHFFKFGVAAPWIEPDSTDFPPTMPFTRVQQRYDALKKYQSRINEGLARIKAVEGSADIADPTAQDVYFLRPMGLLANSMLASENTGSTNELFLARWYINEMYLLINDARTAATPDDAKRLARAARKAANSYLSMMNRVITSKVGDKFEYI